MVLLDSTAILQAAPCILIQPFSLQFLVYTKIPCMIGTGKTQLIAGMLRELPPAEFISIGINLNYYSTATVLLGSLEAPLRKHDCNRAPRERHLAPKGCGFCCWHS